MHISISPFLSHPIFLPSSVSSYIILYPTFSDEKPLSVEVGEASTLRLLGAEQENAELRRRLEELQAQQEVRVQRSKVMTDRHSRLYFISPLLKVKDQCGW